MAVSKKKDMDMKMTFDPQRAIAELTKVISKQEAVIQKMRQSNVEASKSKQTFGSANKEMGDMSIAANKAAASVVSLIGTFVSIGTIIQGLRELKRELESISQTRKEMFQTSLTLDEMALRIANLPGRRDVSQAGIGAVKNLVEQVARRGNIPLEAAASTLFMAESALGTGPQATLAAENIARFAAPAGLAPEDVTQLPKLFDIMQATNEKRQMEVLNQIAQAAGASIATTGEFTQSFMKIAVPYMQRGFTLPQTLARMVSMVQVSGGVEEAATATRTGMEIATGRTKQALEFYSAQARQRGITYGRLTDPERLQFAKDLFDEFSKLTAADIGAVAGLTKEERKAGLSPLDVLKTRVGGRGYAYMQMMFGETAWGKYEDVLPLIQQATTADFVQRQAADFAGTIMAANLANQIKKTVAAGVTGQEFKALTMLDEKAIEIVRQAKATTRDWGEIMDFVVTPGFLEKRQAAEIFLNQNIEAAFHFAETEDERERIRQLQKRLDRAKVYRMHPELMEEIYQATGGFTAAAEYNYPIYQTYMRYIPPGGRGDITSALLRGYERVEGITGEKVDKLTDAIKENTEQLKRQNDGRQNYIVPDTTGALD